MSNIGESKLDQSGSSAPCAGGARRATATDSKLGPASSEGAPVEADRRPSAAVGAAPGPVRRPSCGNISSVSSGARPNTIDLDNVVDCHCATPMASLGLEHVMVHSPTSSSSSRPGGLTKPKRIIIVRHGESLGNVDEQVYETTPDWKVPLSPRGHEQARDTGRKLKTIVGSEPLYIYTSPYVRTKQTLANLLESLEDNVKVGIREEPRITEQQFGNFQNETRMRLSKRDRDMFGRFYYRFPEGESGLDVYSRVTSFISTMFRDFADSHICRPDLNVIIVTHGLTLRLLLMRWFKFTVDTFEATTNPGNGSFVLMERREALQDRPGGGYELSEESAALISLQCSANLPIPLSASSSSRAAASSPLAQQQPQPPATAPSSSSSSSSSSCCPHDHQHRHHHDEVAAKEVDEDEEEEKEQGRGGK